MSNFRHYEMIYTAPIATQIVRLGWRGVLDALAVACGAVPVRALTFGVFAKRTAHGGIVVHGGELKPKAAP